jgi:hypothetical protein
VSPRKLILQIDDCKKRGYPNGEGYGSWIVKGQEVWLKVSCGFFMLPFVFLFEYWQKCSETPCEENATTSCNWNLT